MNVGRIDEKSKYAYEMYYIYMTEKSLVICIGSRYTHLQNAKLLANIFQKLLA